MALEKKEFDELLSRFFENSGIEDPEVSIIPDGTRFPGIARNKEQNDSQKITDAPIPKTMADKYAEKMSNGTLTLSCWRVASDTNPIDRRGVDISSTLQEKHHVDYSLKSVVGKGGFGQVWEAIQTSMGRTIALKRLLQSEEETVDAEDESYAELKSDFRREALTTAFLEHPNIVPVHDLGEDEKGRPLLAMKLLKGDLWNDMLRNDIQVMPFREYIQKHLLILIDVCQAVAFAHSRGIVHRDLKPAQVIVGEFGETILMDWGIAMLDDPKKLVDDYDEIADQIAPTREHAVNPAGTPAYMAPEQTKEYAHDIGPWTDVYLLGGVLYYILCGRAPHACGSAAEAFKHATAGKIKPPKYRKPELDIPGELDAIAIRALKLKPEERYSTVSELIEAIQDYQAGSSRKAESYEISDMISEMLQSDGQDYQILSEFQNNLFQAINLWPENNDAIKMQIEVARRFTKLALENNDLVLARLMLRSVSDKELEEQLNHEIELKERQAKRDKKRRLILNIVIIVFVIVIILDIIFIVRHLN